MERKEFKKLKKGMVVRLKSKSELLREGWRLISQEYGEELTLVDNYYEYSVVEPMMMHLGDKVVVAEDAEDMGNGIMDVWLEDFEGNRLHGSWTPGMIKCCLDLIEAPGEKVESVEVDTAEQVGLIMNLTDAKQEWMAGFIAGYEMALKHMKGERE